MSQVKTFTATVTDEFGGTFPNALVAVYSFAEYSKRKQVLQNQLILFYQLRVSMRLSARLRALHTKRIIGMAKIKNSWLQVSPVNDSRRRQPYSVNYG